MTSERPHQRLVAKFPISNQKKPITKEADHKNPNLWTTEQNTNLLELIINYTHQGHGTNNVNLKKDYWVALSNNLNNACTTSLDIQQFEFRCDQDHATPTTNPHTWYKLIQTHPQHSFNKLRGKSFPWYDLAEEVSLVQLPVDLWQTNTSKKTFTSMKVDLLDPSFISACIVSKA
ncbi:uncharacterized protein VP01_1452g3 [Puccinia sorghi]|uniref:Myb/SANT-like domain-containing protein n=1 Tax=Puccinia sorghi TaxID=27349 RepID=A0A0L6VK62_9BASI|nr:uncharacterized protein VP01_1452g3 [Puccinia sorghi]